jgi:hypothetical protein
MELGTGRTGAAVTIHEMGHVLGAPDFYTNGDVVNPVNE